MTATTSGQCKFQIHRLAKKIGEKDERRGDKESDLQTRSHSNSEAETHLVFHRHQYRRRMRQNSSESA